MVMVPLLIVAGIYLFKQFSKELNHRMDQELIATEVQWIRYLQNRSDNGVTFSLRLQTLDLPVNAPVTAYPTIRDVFDASRSKDIPLPPADTCCSDQWYPLSNYHQAVSGAKICT